MNGRTDYYRGLRELALTKRAEHRVETASLDLPFIQRIYKAEGIRMDRWDIKGRKIRAAYFCDDGDCSVLINKNLPREPRLFSLVHELKHHYADQESIRDGRIQCGDYNANQKIEIGAEVFAAEFIYPEQEFLDCISTVGIELDKCTKEDVVRLKRACAAPVSYTFLRKRLERMGFADPGDFAKVQFQKLEEEMFGLPIYKQPWFVRHRQRQRQ